MSCDTPASQPGTLTYNQQLNTYNFPSRFTIHHSLFTIHYSPSELIISSCAVYKVMCFRVKFVIKILLMKRNPFQRFGKRLINYFFQGLLYLAPVTITLWVLYRLFVWVDSLFTGTIKNLTGIAIPGLGFIVLLVIISLVGLLGSTFIFHPVVNYLDKLLTQTPLIKIVYTSVKDLVSAFVGQKKRFNEPVLIRLSKNMDMERVGFITNRDLSLIGEPNEKVAVYLPHAYAWSGNVYIVPADNVKKIDASSMDVMKFIISAGVSNLNNK